MAQPRSLIVIGPSWAELSSPPTRTTFLSFTLQATKLFIVTSATKGVVVTTPARFSVSFKILYRVIQPFIQHCLLRRMVYLNVIYVIATRNYELFTSAIVS